MIDNILLLYVHMLDFCSGVGQNWGILLDGGPIRLVLRSLIIFELHILLYDIFSLLGEQHVSLHWLSYATTRH